MRKAVGGGRVCCSGETGGHVLTTPATSNVTGLRVQVASVREDCDQHQTHNGCRTRRIAESMVPMEDDALSLAQEMACWCVPALNFFARPILAQPLLIHRRLRPPGQHLLGVQGCPTCTPQPSHSPIPSLHTLWRCQRLPCAAHSPHV